LDARRFPPPWIVEEHNNACFIVKDATGQALGYFYRWVDAVYFSIYPATKASNSCRLAQIFFFGKVGINSQSSGGTSSFVGLDIPI
jgi:hypothetical protein